MRVFFIPGLGEELFIFDKIKPHIPGDQVFIDNWTHLKNLREEGLNVLVYAQYLIDQFAIKKEDVVIGHSMGAWIAVFIKQLAGCSIVQIAGWTDSDKIVTIPLNRSLMFRLAKYRWVFNPVARDLLIWLNYRNKPSRDVFKRVYEKLRTGDRTVVANQLRVIFTELREPITVAPDLRIHAKGDKIVAPPDESFVKVPGDHFSLYTYPETVYEPIVSFLNNLENRG